MRISQADSAIYKAKERILFREVDYNRFQENATSLIQSNHDDESKQQWTLFCKHLNMLDEKKPEKLMLMQVAFHCFSNPLTSTELAQFITLCTQLKLVYGLELFGELLEANVAENNRKMQDYLTVLQLLMNLYEVDGISKTVKKYLHDLQKLIGNLQTQQNKYHESKYPKRNIDQVLEYFATPNDTTQFPLTKAVLAPFKNDYLAIEVKIKEFKIIPQEALKTLFLQQGKLFKDKKDPFAKQIMIAIMVETISRIYQILPYDTQIIALLALVDNVDAGFKGRIAQIKTGEGKSIIIAMLAAFKAVQNLFVNIITSSGYLAKRDWEKYSAFYQALGLSASYINYQDQKPEQFHALILYGTNAAFEFAILRDGLSKTKLRYSYPLAETKLIPRSDEVMIVDEVDNMLLDDLGAAKMSIPGHEDFSWIYRPILDFVTTTLKSNPASKNCTVELRNYLKTHLNPQKLTELVKIADAKLSRWIHSAQIAYYYKKENRDYIIKGDEVVPVDYMFTGRTHDGTQWSHGVHQFIQVINDLKKITPESLSSAAISHPSFFSSGKEIYGLTGTMGESIERLEVEEIYGLTTFDVPPHFPSQRKMLNPKILVDTNKQYDEIFKSIKNMQAAGRPILILFESIEESEEFCKFLLINGIKHQLLNEKQRESEDYIISRAGDPKMVTVATNTAGRGTDIILSPESKEAGLHMVFAFYPDNSRVEAQGFGRAARQGQQGSCEMILQANDNRILSLLASAPIELVLKQWIGEKSNEQKFHFINQLRTAKIQIESNQRRFSSKLENIYFIYLNKFFSTLQSFYVNLGNENFHKQLKQICEATPKPTPCLIALKETDPKWTAVYSNARILVSNQSMRKSVDWSSFIDQYKEALTEHLLEKWGLFYSKLADDVEGMDIVRAEQFIQTAYGKLNLPTLFASETTMICLSFLLHQASLPPKSKITNQTSLGLFAQNPKELYKKAIEYYNDKNFQLALEYCCNAIEIYKNAKKEQSIAIGNCYSTQASCYRELKQFDESLLHCEKSIGIFYHQKSGTERDELLTAIESKYHDCLAKSKFDISILYPRAVTLYNDKNYLAATYKLQFLLKNLVSMSNIHKGRCYSTLASCCRESGKVDDAVGACKNAIEYFNKANQPLLAKEVESKLEKLNLEHKNVNKILGNTAV